MDAEQIGVVFTGKDCELQKPRLLLGSICWRWMHWRDRSVPCLRDYGVECKPCGEQREYAFLTASLVEQTKETSQFQDDRPAKWAALSEVDREACRREVRSKTVYRGCSPGELLDGACMFHLWGAPDHVERKPTYFPTRRILQCVPGPALEGMDIDNLRGLVVAIRKDRYSHIRLVVLPIQLETTPDDFDPQPVFDRRYGLDRLARPAPEPAGDEPPAILPFRKQA